MCWITHLWRSSRPVCARVLVYWRPRSGSSRHPTRWCHGLWDSPHSCWRRRDKTRCNQNLLTGLLRTESQYCRRIRSLGCLPIWWCSPLVFVYLLVVVIPHHLCFRIPRLDWTAQCDVVWCFNFCVFQLTYDFWRFTSFRTQRQSARWWNSANFY